MFAAAAQYARETIHAFNETGFAALDPNGAGADPGSLTKLTEHLAAVHRIVVHVILCALWPGRGAAETRSLPRTGCLVVIATGSGASFNGGHGPGL
jgi:hypothetical protein